MIPSAEGLDGNTDFNFQRALPPSHSTRSTKTWFDAHARPQNKDELMATIKIILASRTPTQRHKLIASMP